MKKLQKILITGLTILAMSTVTLTAFAATYTTPAQLVASITGKTEQEVIAERISTGKTYGTIAADAGKLSEYIAGNIEMKKANLQAQVASGKITQAQADKIIAALKANSASCDGTGTAKIGQANGAKFGSNGSGLGTGGANRGSGTGRGANGGGMGLGRAN